MEISQIKKYIFKNVYTGLIKTAFTLVLSVVVIPIIIKNIGIDNYGIVSIVLVFSSLTGMLDLGLSKALISFQGNQKENKKEISAIYILNFGLFAAMLLFTLVVFTFKINLMGGKLKVDSSTLRLINTIAILLLSFGIFNNLLRASLEANFKLQLVNWGYLIQAAIINIGWLILALTKAPIRYFLLIPVAGTVVTIIYHLIYLPPIYTWFLKPDKASFKKVFGITFQFFKVGALNSAHLPLIKYVIIIFLGGGGRTIGIFQLSTKLAVMANTLLAYISNPFFSIVAKHKEKSKVYLWGVIQKVTKFLIGATLVGYAVFFIFNKFLIQYFFKEYTTEIFHVLNIVVIGYLFIATSESIQKYMLGIGKVNLVAKIKLTGIFLNGLAIIWLLITGNLNLVNIALVYSFSLVSIGLFWLFLSLKSDKQ